MGMNSRSAYALHWLRQTQRAPQEYMEYEVRSFDVRRIAARRRLCPSPRVQSPSTMTSIARSTAFVDARCLAVWRNHVADRASSVARSVSTPLSLNFQIVDSGRRRGLSGSAQS